MKKTEEAGQLDTGVVVLSPDYRVIGINKYASEVLQLSPSDIGKNVYAYHSPKTYSRITSLLNRVRRSSHNISEPIIMDVMNKKLAVNLCRMVLKEGSLRHLFIMTFIDITAQKGAEGNKKHRAFDVSKIPVFNGGSYLFLDIPSVYLIKSEGNYCMAYADNEQYYLRVTLKEIEKKFGKKLFRVHRGFLVNLDKVHRIIKHAKGQMLVDFNRRNVPLVPVSRRRAAGLRKALRLIKDTLRKC